MLTLEVGARVELAPGHDYKLVTENITQAQRDKLATAGPKYGAVVRLSPEKCSYAVGNRSKEDFKMSLSRFGCSECSYWWKLGGCMQQRKEIKNLF